MPSGDSAWLAAPGTDGDDALHDGNIGVGQWQGGDGVSLRAAVTVSGVTGAGLRAQSRRHALFAPRGRSSTPPPPRRYRFRPHHTHHSRIQPYQTPQVTPPPTTTTVQPAFTLNTGACLTFTVS